MSSNIANLHRTLGLKDLEYSIVMYAESIGELLSWIRLEGDRLLPTKEHIRSLSES